MCTNSALTVVVNNLDDYKGFYLVASHAANPNAIIVHEYIPASFVVVGKEFHFEGNYDGLSEGRTFAFKRQDNTRIEIFNITNLSEITVYGVK